MIVELLDVDTLNRAPFCGHFFVDREGYSCAEQGAPLSSRRWRPAMILGQGIESFIPEFFTLPAGLPWAGLVFATDAQIASDGLVVVGTKLLLGHSLMYPVVCFPYQETKIGADQIDGHRWEVELPKAERTLRGLTCNLCSPGLAIYGHWLVDALPRLHRAISSGLVIDQFILPAPRLDWQSALLQATSIDATKILYVDLSEERVSCERVVVPTFDRFNSEVRPDLLNVHLEISQKLSPRTEGDNSDLRIFVSRASWGGARSLINRHAIEERFARNGFQVLRPEQISFPEQVQLFGRARVVVGECGSGLHNTVYSRRGTRVGVLQASDNPNFLQAQLAMVAGHEAWYLVGERSQAVNRQAFSVDVDCANRFIRHILAE